MRWRWLGLDTDMYGNNSTLQWAAEITILVEGCQRKDFHWNTAQIYSGT